MSAKHPKTPKTRKGEPVSNTENEKSLAVIDGETLPETLNPPEGKDREISKRKRGEALTNGEVRAMLLLRDQGLSQTEIAFRLNCNQSTISRALAEWADTKVEATAFLKSKSLHLAKKLVKNADTKDALEILDRTGTLEKKRNEDGGNKVNVMIGIKLPDGAN